jgi:hypothetical protein
VVWRKRVVHGGEEWKDESLVDRRRVCPRNMVMEGGVEKESRGWRLFIRRTDRQRGHSFGQPRIILPDQGSEPQRSPFWNFKNLNSFHPRSRTTSGGGSEG